jgi:hypothetical protein
VLGAWSVVGGCRVVRGWRRRAVGGSGGQKVVSWIGARRVFEAPQLGWVYMSIERKRAKLSGEPKLGGMLRQDERRQGIKVTGIDRFLVYYQFLLLNIFYHSNHS